MIEYHQVLHTHSLTPSCLSPLGTCPGKTHRASATGAHFTDLAVDRSKPDGFVFEKRPRETPCGIVGRFGQARFGQFPAGDIADCNQTGLAGNRCGDFMRPILATVGDFSRAGL